uniref:Uncharacterized protein n=1 Tax=Panagrolaimus superbus TaxID=310955 RepID=A0A914YE71_9BILA
MAGFRFFLIAVLIFGIISITYGASLKAYNPYGVKRRTTTTSPTSTSIYASTPSTTTVTNTTVAPKEMIRHCTCTESEECITNSWSNITPCQEKCKSKLSFFGNDTSFGLKCIKNNPKDADLINTCFKTIPGYCAKTNDSQIEKPTYEAKDPKKVKIVEHEIVKAFRAFHMCAGECMKDIILNCFEQKECGVKLGETQDIGKIGEFCHAVKSSIVTASAQSLPCIYPGLKRRGKNNKKQ